MATPATPATDTPRDPATGRPLPRGVAYVGPSQYRARAVGSDGNRLSRTFDTARLAREWLEGVAVCKRRGDVVVSTSALRGTTLAELVATYEVEILVEGSATRRGGVEDRGHTVTLRTHAIGALSLDRLTPAAVERYRDDQLAAGMAPATVVKRLNLLARILTWGRQAKKLPLTSNPASAEAVARPRGADQRRDRVLLPAPHEGTDGQPPRSERELLEAAIAKSSNGSDVYLVRFALEQGVRLGEATGLAWRDVDFRTGVLTIRGRAGLGGKTAHKRKTLGFEKRPLLAGARGVLLELCPDERDRSPDAFVFGVNGKAEVAAFKVRYARLVERGHKALPEIYRAAGFLDDLRFHDLRHDATTRLSALFPDSRDLMAVTGHADVKSLVRYQHPDLGELARRSADGATQADDASELAWLRELRSLAEGWVDGDVDEGELREFVEAARTE